MSNPVPHSAGPQWLSTEQRRAWLALLSTLATLPREFDAPLQRAAQLTLFDYNVLAMLSEQSDGRLPMSELASRTAASLSRLSHVVRKLEGRGLLSRSAHPADGRVTTAELSVFGRQLVEQLAPEHVEQVQRLIFQRLDATEVEQLDQILRKLLSGIDQNQWIFRAD
ncbi:MarR family transcriptional regulator [Psychromicrobium lacuslunae]|uniref:MarR family transcriptional regulator n=1 Tax=Psychromicrobium lacuslunae TaxID=1618207 RepID=A0A0D4C3Z7_9MICC|nr:MarR family transcriptional regulator [Psychromicrobium lacuslunae]